MTNLPRIQYVHPDGRTIVVTEVEYEKRYRAEGFRPLDELISDYEQDPRVSKISK